jgi:hypothetical protein
MGCGGGATRHSEVDIRSRSTVEVTTYLGITSMELSEVLQHAHAITYLMFVCVTAADP